MRWLVVVLTMLAASAGAQGVLDVAGVPGLTAAGRALYADFLASNTPRVFALDRAGHAGWYSGGKDLAPARLRAMALCVEQGGSDCQPYAEDLSVVWPGRAWAPPAPPPPLVDTMNYAFEPDSHFLWHGPAQALGVVVWSHGSNPPGTDPRAGQAPSLLRPFNNAGFDVVGFDRSPLADNPVRAADWLRTELAALRRMGYRRIVAAGQSRGAWTSLQILDTARLADAVIALSPAAHGSGNSPNLTAQADDLRQMMADAAPSATRVALAQFTADPFAGDLDRRAELFGRLRGKVGAVLMIDRPPGLEGHYGGTGQIFATRFGACLLRFATDPAPPTACP